MLWSARQSRIHRPNILGPGRAELTCWTSRYFQTVFSHVLRCPEMQVWCKDLDVPEASCLGAGKQAGLLWISLAVWHALQLGRSCQQDPARIQLGSHPPYRLLITGLTRLRSFDHALTTSYTALSAPASANHGLAHGLCCQGCKVFPEAGERGML